MKAMLFDEVPQEEVIAVDDMLTDDDFWLEQKMDGARVLAHISPDGVIFTQRNGEPVKFAAALQHLPKIAESLIRQRHRAQQVILDGELIISTGQFHVFDLVVPDVPHVAWDRRAMLEAWLVEDDEVRIVRVAERTEAKRDLYQQAIKAGVEGVMFKHSMDAYLPGKRAEQSVKVKFTKRAEVIVIDRSLEPNSALLGMIDAEGKVQEVGRVTLTGKGLVNSGDVIEVEYLYWTGASMYQTRMIRQRPDKRWDECTMRQLKPYRREVLGL